MKIFASPGEYIQGRGVIEDLDKHLKEYENALILYTPSMARVHTETFEKATKEVKGKIVEFGGGGPEKECSEREIGRIIKIVEDMDASVVVGMGGGKTMDTAKAVAYRTGKRPVITVPTIASTDAACSRQILIYTEGGVFERVQISNKNPEKTIVDTALIASSPSRFFVAGLGDALSTYFEAEACNASNSDNEVWGKQTMASLTLARMSYDTLIGYGPDATESVKINAATEAVEKVVESTTLISTIGFESGGLAAAHAIHNGFTELEETHQMLHGEKVAFSTIAQTIIEGRPKNEINEVIEFCNKVGLPTTLAGLGIEEIDEQDIMKVAEGSCDKEGHSMSNMPFEVEPKRVKDAIMLANRLGKQLS